MEFKTNEGGHLDVYLATHGWYNPLSDTDPYVESLQHALKSVGVSSMRLHGHNLQLMPFVTESEASE
ncbi:MAG: hypothetical protein JRN15_14075, partial [Nitrososphaerota archaeon]|nr:hypothetical protein [Nitrososphaerota archaeon]